MAGSGGAGRGHGESPGVLGMFHVLVWLVVIEVCPYIIILGAVHLRLTPFVACQLYFKKIEILIKKY